MDALAEVLTHTSRRLFVMLPTTARPWLNLASGVGALGSIHRAVTRAENRRPHKQIRQPPRGAWINGRPLAWRPGEFRPPGSALSVGVAGGRPWQRRDFPSPSSRRRAVTSLSTGRHRLATGPRQRRAPTHGRWASTLAGRRPARPATPAHTGGGSASPRDACPVIPPVGAVHQPSPTAAPAWPSATPCLAAAVCACAICPRSIPRPPRRGGVWRRPSRGVRCRPVHFRPAQRGRHCRRRRRRGMIRGRPHV